MARRKKAGTAGSHGSPLGADEIEGARQALGWEHGPFEVPDSIYADWQAMAKRNAAARKGWNERLEASNVRDAFIARLAGGMPQAAADALKAHIAKIVADKPKLATRAASGKVLEAIASDFPALVGGSADLTGSNLTKASSQAIITSDDFFPAATSITACASTAWRQP